MGEHRVIWKFGFRFADHVVVEMPENARLLHVDVSDDAREDMCVWAMVWPNGRKVMRKLRIYGTGHPCDAEEHPERHVGTVRIGCFIWHVFDGGEAP